MFNFPKGGNYPFTVQSFPEELCKKYESLKKLAMVGPKNHIISENMAESNIMEEFYNFKPRPTDTLLFGFPRSGTTIMQEIIWLLENNLDYETAKTKAVDDRITIFEGFVFDDLKNKNVLTWIWNLTKNRTDHRQMKTHFPLSLANPDLLKTGSKIVYIARNPKDVIVSGFHIFRAFRQNFVAEIDSFEQFWQGFKNNFVIHSPYFEHVKEAWTLRDHPNLLFLFYEDFRKDSKKFIQRVADFLEKTLTEEELETLNNHLSIDNFRKNKAVNNERLREIGFMENEPDNFIRKGKVGGWREYFKGSLEEDVNEWIRTNLEHTDLKFPE